MAIVEIKNPENKSITLPLAEYMELVNASNNKNNELMLQVMDEIIKTMNPIASMPMVSAQDRTHNSMYIIQSAFRKLGYDINFHHPVNGIVITKLPTPEESNNNG